MNTSCDVEDGMFSESPDFGSDRAPSTPSAAEWPNIEDFLKFWCTDKWQCWCLELGKCVLSSVRSLDN